MDLEFKPGDRVNLTDSAGCYYGGNPKWIPPSQGGGTAGYVLFAGERPYDPRAAARPYFVRWDNGAENSYRVDDLQAAPRIPLVVEEQPNVITFNR